MRFCCSGGVDVTPVHKLKDPRFIRGKLAACLLYDHDHPKSLPHNRANVALPSMSARHFCIPGLFILFCAFILSLIVSISLPSLPALDIARTKFSGGTTEVTSIDGGVNELRVRGPG